MQKRYTFFVLCTIMIHIQACIPRCGTCEFKDMSLCLTCNLGATLQLDNSCQCDDGYYQDSILGTCQNCHDSCKTCSGSQPSDCSTCEYPRKMISSFCLLETDQVQVQGQQNLRLTQLSVQCPIGQFILTATQTCANCHPICKQCTGFTYKDCISCNSTTFLQTYFISVPNQQQYVYNSIAVTGAVESLQCNGVGVVTVTNPNIMSVSMTWYLMSTTSTVLTTTFSNSLQSTFNIPAETAIAGKNYTLFFNVTVNAQTSSTSQLFTFVQQPLQVIIQGGDQTIGVADILTMTPLIYDPNNQVQALQDLSKYTLVWTCMNVAHHSLCKDSSRAQLTFPQQTNGQLTYPALTFTPYSSFYFNLTVTDKFGTSSVGQVKISVSKSLISSISLNLISALPFQQVDIYQPLQFQFKTQDFFTAADVTYQVAVQYQGEVVKTFTLSYPKFSIRLFDAIPVFNSLSSNKITVVGFVSSKNQKIPSTSTLTLNLNPPAFSCQVMASPGYGTSLTTQFSLGVSGCITANTPLLYRYFYYQDIYIYNTDRASNSFSNGLALTNLVTYQQITTMLAGYSDQRANVIILVQVKDSLGNVAYISKQISLNPITTQKIDLVALKIKLSSTSNLGDQLNNLNMISFGLGRIISTPVVTLFKLNMLNQAQALLNSYSNAAQLSQIWQTVALIMLNKDVIKSFDSSQTQQMLDSIDSQISKLQGIAPTSIKSGSVIMTSLTSLLSSIIARNNQSTSQQYNNTLMAQQNSIISVITEQNTQILKTVDNIINYLTSPLYPNSPLVKVVKANLKFQLGFANELGLAAITGVNLLLEQQSINGFRILQNSKTRYYAYRIVEFSSNIKSGDSTYPYPEQNTSLIQIQITQSNSSTFDAKQQVASSSLIKQPITLYVPTSGGNNDVRQTCISQPVGDWTNNTCSTLMPSQGTVLCICSQPGFFSVIDDYDGIYLPPVVIQVQAPIPWYKILLYLLFVLFTSFYITVAASGYYKDSNFVQIIHPENDQPKLKKRNAFGMISPEPELLNISDNTPPIKKQSSVDVFTHKIIPDKLFKNFFSDEHYLINCIFTYDPTVSRPARSIINFSCQMITITMAVFFGYSLDFVKTSLIAIVSSILNIAFTSMFLIVFRSNNNTLKSSGYYIILVIDIILFIIFIIVSTEAADETFRSFDLQFFISILVDNLIIQTIKIIVQFKIQDKKTV